MNTHVVIVGGGFAGLYTARRLADQPVQITIIDRQNHHLFQPLLYQVATAGLSPADIATPIRALVEEHPNVRVMLAEVTSVDLPGKRVHLGNGERVDFDYLVLATGVRHSYFGKDSWEALAPGLKTLDDALEIRRRVLWAFEQAEKEPDRVKRAAWLTFVVVGGGPTGVELAGAISELAHYTVAGEFRTFDPSRAHVVLVEASDEILSAFHDSLSEAALGALRAMHVDVRLGARVTDITPQGVQMGDTFVPSHTVMWAAGVTAGPLTRSLGVEVDRLGRVKVNPDLSVPGHPEVFVVGDVAHALGPDGQPLPGLAPVAIQQGKHTADNIAALLDRRETRPFEYFDKGIMATVGRAFGIAQTGKIRVSGVLGWLAWLFIHLLYLIGFRNRLLVMIQWLWAWLTYGRSARLITGLPALALRPQTAMAVSSPVGPVTVLGPERTTPSERAPAEAVPGATAASGR